MIGIKLPKFKQISINEIKEYVNPKSVYFEIKENDEILVKENDTVEIGTPIIKNTKKETFIHSSVSGKVKKITKKINSLNIETDFLEIENNFKEKDIFKKQKISKLDKKEFIEILKQNGIVGLGGAGFPTYKKYDNVEIKTLIINAVECEPYITADYMLTVNYIKEVIEVLNLILEIFNMEEIFIAIKTHNQLLKDKIIPFTNNKIKLIEVPNLYPMGWEKSLVRYIKHTDYKKLPIEKGIVISNISTIYSIYEAVYCNKPLIEKIITVTGNAINKPTNIKIRIGTPFNELIKICGNYNTDSVSLVAGGPMMGNSISTDQFIIPNNLNCVLILNEQHELKPITCLRCGKCSDNCPVKISPVLVKDNINNKSELQRLDVNRCIGCGICSYVCPSKINLREYVQEAKKKVK